MLTIKKFVFNPFDENTYLLIDSATHEAAVVDPGMFTEKDLRVFDEYVRAHNITITQVINTHMHVDHCFGDNYVHEKYGSKIAAHTDDDFFAAAMEQQAARFGMVRHMRPVTIDRPLADGDTIRIGQSALQVLHVPGHSPGGIALYDKEDGWVISGDSLFRNSIGRTDFEGGNRMQLVNAIHSKLLSLPDDTVVLPGHGPASTIGREKVENPYL